jgi:uncharacterized membrane protein
MRIKSLGHALFAATMVGLGILGLVQGRFTPIWGGVPKSFPGREGLAYTCALVLLTTGIGLFWRRSAAVASRVLLVYLLAWLLLLRLPLFFTGFTVDIWWAAAQAAVLVAAAWVLYVWFAGEEDAARVGFATGDRGLRIARALYGMGLIPFGIAHFMYLERTASLVPGWLPWHVGFSYFTGGTFILAGLAVLVGVYARLAAALAALQIGLFTLLVWVPIIVAGTAKPSDWQEFIASIALTTVAWVVADSYRGMP